jgi:hypothetical protein
VAATGDLGAVLDQVVAAAAGRPDRAGWLRRLRDEESARLGHPDRQVVLLLGDGAASFSLLDIDTLVRFKLPVVVIVGTTAAGGWRGPRCSRGSGTTSPPSCAPAPATTRWCAPWAATASTPAAPCSDRR